VQRADKSAPTSGNQTVILVTHATMEQSVRNTIEAIEGEGYLIAKAQVIRIEGNEAN
tara:strand:+ start:159 stop:329 length:171 start_codon:yes stop_codon:yes gene_type:complete